MAYRSKMKPRKDSRIFTRTAMKTKKINVMPRLIRGGIRL